MAWLSTTVQAQGTAQRDAGGHHILPGGALVACYGKVPWTGGQAMCQRQAQRKQAHTERKKGYFLQLVGQKEMASSKGGTGQSGTGMSKGGNREQRW